MNKKSQSSIWNKWKVVFFSAMGATTFWLFNELSQTHSALVKYPISFEFTEDSLVMLEPLPEYLELDISSTGWNLFKNTLHFFVEPILFQLDNPTDIRYLTLSAIEPIVTDHLKGLQINFIITDTLKINVEKRLTRKVKLIVDSLYIPLKTNYRMASSISIEPQEISVTGAYSLVASMADEYYLSLGETELTNDFNETIPISLPFENVMRAIPSEARVKFDVDELVIKQIELPIQFYQFPSNVLAQIQDSTIMATIRAPKPIINKLSIENFIVTSDYVERNRLDQTTPVKIQVLDSLIEIVSFVPKKISLKGQ